LKFPTKFTYFDISPNGPGLVVEVDGDEIFIPAVEVATAMGALGYQVFTPPSISTRATVGESPDEES
jgi:hypothetical protein